MSQEKPGTVDYPGHPTLPRLASFDLTATDSESTQKRFVRHRWLAGSAFLTPPRPGGVRGRGLIARGRRQVTILDRQGLMAASCECNQLVRTRLAFHFPKTYT